MWWIIQEGTRGVFLFVEDVAANAETLREFSVRWVKTAVVQLGW